MTRPADPARPVRILQLGHCHSVFVHPLTVNLLRHGNFEVSIFELFAPGTEVRGVDPSIYKNILHFPVVPPIASRWQGIREVFRTINWRARWHLLKSALRSGSSKFRTDLRIMYTAFRRTAMLREMLAGYDIYSFHYIDPRLVEYVRLLPAGVKCVATVWGSDLFCMAGTETYAKQLEIYERADLINIHSIEMIEIFLSKFGRHLQPKIRSPRFGMNYLALIDANRTPENKTRFAATHRIANDRIVICVGNNGRPENAHLPVLTALSQLPADQRKRLTVILPMTYGGQTSDYVNAVKAMVCRLDLDARLLETYLTDAEVGQLRAWCDIYIQVPDTDGFSVSMRETLYAENIVVAGAWLPYGELRRKGIHYREVESVPDVTATVNDILADLPREKARMAGTREKIRNLYGWDNVITGWIDVYRELIQPPAVKT